MYNEWSLWKICCSLHLNVHDWRIQQRADKWINKHPSCSKIKSYKWLWRTDADLSVVMGQMKKKNNNNSTSLLPNFANKKDTFWDCPILQKFPLYGWAPGKKVEFLKRIHTNTKFKSLNILPILTLSITLKCLTRMCKATFYRHEHYIVVGYRSEVINRMFVYLCCRAQRHSRHRPERRDGPVPPPTPIRTRWARRPRNNWQEKINFFFDHEKILMNLTEFTLSSWTRSGLGWKTMTLFKKVSGQSPCF